MGCGKSSVGRELSRLLCCLFVDLDSAVEEKAGRKIPEIFASDGEAVFRQMERDALTDILEKQCTSLTPSTYAGVLALGGGTVMTPECAEMVHEKTLCIYLRASVDTLMRNLSGRAESRPMLRTPSQTSSRGADSGMSSRGADSSMSSRGAERRGDLLNRIEELMALRSATYESTAHIIIDTDGKSVEDIAGEIASAYSNLTVDLN